MPTKADFEQASKLAIKNIVSHGDTDILPFPFERFILEDKEKDVVELLHRHNDSFDDHLARYSPLNVSALAPVSYFGFRWATQLDYIWNVYLRACVLVISKEIEDARIPVDDNCVFSYRLAPDTSSGSLFDRSVGFRAFMEKSLALSREYEYVVLSDISEFYPRLGHHRLENALRQVDPNSEYPKKIMSFLGNFSKTNSFGLPIGGPAARILSEVTINQIDRLLIGKRIRFARFADDYHIFAHSREDAYRNLIFLSEKLSMNQGLTLQKSKTRIMSSAEFQATFPAVALGDDDAAGDRAGPPAEAAKDRREDFLKFSLRFDPYSPNAQEDYDRLKNEVRRFDILSILREELAKSRVHTGLTRKLVRAIQFLDEDVREGAVLSVMENCETLYPVFSAVLVMIEQVVDTLGTDTKREINKRIAAMIDQESHIFRVDLHVSYAVRVLAHFNDPETIGLLQRLYELRNSPIIRRDVILAMARWGEWYWLSDIKNNFRQLSTHERRAFIVASYTLKDEGRHWREHIFSELSPFEKLVKEWAAEKFNGREWSIAL